MTTPKSATDVELDTLANRPSFPDAGSPFAALPHIQLYDRPAVATPATTPTAAPPATPASTAATTSEATPHASRDVTPTAVPSATTAAAAATAAVVAPTSGNHDLSQVEKAEPQHKGYMRFSSWMASDDDFFVVRRFQSLNAHTILYMQNRIARVDERLWQLEDRDGMPNAEVTNDSFEWDSAHLPEREKLLQQLTGLLHHYNQYIDTYTQIRDRPAAERYQITNLRRQVKAGIICNKETGFAENKNDLISISPRRYSPFEAIMRSNPHVRQAFLRFRPTRRHTWVEPMSSQARAEIFPPSELTGSYARGVDTFVLFLGIGLIMIPLWLVYWVATTAAMFVIVSTFVVILAMILGTMTTHRPFEILALCAAYAAVLVAISDSSIQPQV